MLEPARRHELQADADAEKGPALLLHRLLQGLDHPRNRGEPRLAIGERADARQHDTLGAQNLLRRRGDFDVEGRAFLPRRPLEGLGGGVEIARAVIDDGDVHLTQACGKSPMTSSPSPPRRGLAPLGTGDVCAGGTDGADRLCCGSQPSKNDRSAS